jgi:hypothetical protein
MSREWWKGQHARDRAPSWSFAGRGKSGQRCGHVTVPLFITLSSSLHFRFRIGTLSLPSSSFSVGLSRKERWVGAEPRCGHGVRADPCRLLPCACSFGCTSACCGELCWSCTSTAQRTTFPVLDRKAVVIRPMLSEFIPGSILMIFDLLSCPIFTKREIEATRPRCWDIPNGYTSDVVLK